MKMGVEIGTDRRTQFRGLLMEIYYIATTQYIQFFDFRFIFRDNYDYSFHIYFHLHSILKTG